jgi:hypothetical protein
MKLASISCLSRKRLNPVDLKSKIPENGIGCRNVQFFTGMGAHKTRFF